VPVIRSFLDREWEVVIASDGDARLLLQKEFPSLVSYELPAYGISYPTASAVLNMIYNAGSFYRGVKKEHREAERIIDLEKPDLIISDNRYGFFHKNHRSIFLGHQISLHASNAVLSGMASFLNRLMIRRFDEVWVPDFEGSRSLTGKLSHGIKGIPVRFIGPLSRFEKKNLPHDYEICAVISGPEPQRSFFETQLTEQLSQLNEQVVIVQGRLNEERDIMLNETTRIISHLTSQELNDLVNKSRVIIARAGYSTIMDLVKLNKRAILVPTPGQTEQIYLSRHLSHKHPFIFQKQKKLNVPAALEELFKLDRRSVIPGEFDVDQFL